MTKQLVYTKRNINFTTSRILAQKFGKRHSHIVEKINNLISDLDKIKYPKSRILKFTKTQAIYRGTTFDVYEMNREAFSLVAMSFTGKKALEWKVKFNEAFYEMEKSLYSQKLNAQSTPWLAQREQAKLIRREETDIIKEFVEYATSQGSTKAQFYYKHITTACYKCLNLIQYKKPKLRETLDIMQTHQLILAEMTARKSLSKWMKEGEHYKAIFTLVKLDLEQFADSFLIEEREL